MIRARSADGVIHQFPDGTPDAVIDRAMRDYAGTRGSKGYAKARARLKEEAALDAKVPKLPGSGFARRVAGSTGALDEVAGGIRYGLQGAENLFRRATGQPIETTAGEAGLAAMDNEREWQDAYAKQNPGKNIFATGLGIAASARPTGLAAAGIRNPFAAGAAVAAQNAPFAVARQEGTLRERLPGAATETALAFGTGAALTAAGNRLASPRRAPRGKVNLEQLKADKSAAYKAVDASGAAYTDDAFRGLVDGIEADLKGSRFDPDFQPDVAKMLSKLRERADSGYAPTISELDDLRQFVRENVVTGATPKEARLGKRMLQGIDEFVANAGPDAMASGSGDEAAGLITRARDLNTRVRKAETITDAVESAQRRAASTGTGGNTDNAIRQNLRRALEKGTNWTPQERQILERAIAGGPVQNALRLVGRLSPNSGGLSLMANLGAVGGGGLMGAAPGAAGMAAKETADRITLANVGKLLDEIVNGGATGTLAPDRARLLLAQLAQAAARDPALVPAYEQALRSLSAQLPGNGRQLPTPEALPAPTTP